MSIFDEIIERRGTNSGKWDGMERNYGVSPKDGLAMWVADTDFRPPQAALDALKEMTDFGMYGYQADSSSYTKAIADWMSSRHKWTVDPCLLYTSPSPRDA